MIRRIGRTLWVIGKDIARPIRAILALILAFVFVLSVVGVICYPLGYVLEYYLSDGTEQVSHVVRGAAGASTAIVFIWVAMWTFNFVNYVNKVWKRTEENGS